MAGDDEDHESIEDDSRAMVMSHLGSRVGRQSSEPFRFGLLVGQGTRVLDIPSQASCHSPGASPILPLSVGLTVGVFTDNTTALSYIKNQGGGALSTVLNWEVQLLLWAELWELTLVPQFIMGTENVGADSLSRRQQVLASKWTLAQDVVKTCRRCDQSQSIFLPQPSTTGSQFTFLP